MLQEMMPVVVTGSPEEAEGSGQGVCGWRAIARAVAWCFPDDPRLADLTGQQVWQSLLDSTITCLYGRQCICKVSHNKFRA
eukprot:scaffold323125_cov36-Prasinocladus_malaysianus.AAC.1